jgi:hypothetical protein
MFQVAFFAGLLFFGRHLFRQYRGVSPARSWRGNAILWGVAVAMAVIVAAPWHRETSVAVPQFSATEHWSMEVKAGFATQPNVGSTQASCMTDVVVGYASTHDEFMALPPSERDYVIQHAWKRCG